MRRCIALVLCMALCFGLFAVPSSAASTLSDKLYTVSNDIFAWLDSALFGGSSVHGGGRANSSFSGGGRYSTYVNDLISRYGSFEFGTSGFYIWASTKDNYVAFIPGATGNVISYGLNTSFNCITDSSGYIYFKFNHFVAPVNGIYKRVFKYSSGTFNNTCLNWYYSSANSRFPDSDKTFTAGSDLILQDELAIIYPRPAGNGTLTFKLGAFVVPAGYSIDSYLTSTDKENRMSNVIPYIHNWNVSNQSTNYYYGSVSDGQVTNIYETNIFDETTNVFTEPSAGTPIIISNWTYDYSTRTYVCIDSSSNTYIVHYGNDAVYVTVPDESGGSVTTTYEYVIEQPQPDPGSTNDTTIFPNPSTDNYTDDPKTTGGFFSTVWKAFTDGLASLIAGIIKGLFKGIKALIDGITFVFSDLVSGFFGFVTSFFNSFGTGPGSVGQFFGGGVVDLD